MNNEIPKDINSETSETKPAQAKPKIPLADTNQQINVTTDKNKISIILPPENDKEANQWNRLIDDFKSRLYVMEKSWQPGMKVQLIAKKRLLDSRQMQTLTDIIREIQLELSLVVTSRRQTAVVAASAGYSVKQEKSVKPLNGNNQASQAEMTDPLYLKNTVRSGVEMRHTGTVIVLGDVNPGGSIIASGDVFIWGTLKGIAHAGATGNRKALIMALKMEPTQLRIADLVARSPDNLPDDFVAEVAYITKEGIRISSAFNFAKNNSFSEEDDIWTNSESKS